MIPPANAFLVQRRVEFRDTDAAGIVHFSAFFPMMEEAEHSLLRHVGLSVMQPRNDGGHLSWPRVSATCDYLGAAHFEDLLDINVTVESLGNKSIRYRFDVLRAGKGIVKGAITAVCCVFESGKPFRSITIPDDIRSRLEPYLVQNE